MMMVAFCSYIAVHSFGRRMLYPGSTSLVQALIGQSSCMLFADWFAATIDIPCFIVKDAVSAASCTLLTQM